MAESRDSSRSSNEEQLWNIANDLANRASDLDFRLGGDPPIEAFPHFLQEIFSSCYDSKAVKSFLKSFGSVSKENMPPWIENADEILAEIDQLVKDYKTYVKIAGNPDAREAARHMVDERDYVPPYGSSTKDEMASRLRDAGYEDWEISEELNLKEWAEKNVRRNTEQLVSQGRLDHIEPNRLDAEKREISPVQPAAPTLYALFDTPEAARAAAISGIVGGIDVDSIDMDMVNDACDWFAFDQDGRLEGLAQETVDLDLYDAWDELGDVPFYEDDQGCMRLESDWGFFKAGTDREEIWHWFDERYSGGVHALLYPSEQETPSTEPSLPAEDMVDRRIAELEWEISEGYDFGGSTRTLADEIEELEALKAIRDDAPASQSLSQSAREMRDASDALDNHPSAQEHDRDER